LEAGPFPGDPEDGHLPAQAGRTVAGMTGDTAFLYLVCFFVAGSMAIIGVKEWVQQLREARRTDGDPDGDPHH
jgi:hypothetical protein